MPIYLCLAIYLVIHNIIFTENPNSKVIVLLKKGIKSVHIVKNLCLKTSKFPADLISVFSSFKSHNGNN